MGPLPLDDEDLKTKQNSKRNQHSANSEYHKTEVNRR